MAPFSKYTKGGMKEGTKIVTGFRDFLLRGNVVSAQQDHEWYKRTVSLHMCCPTPNQASTCSADSEELCRAD